MNRKKKILVVGGGFAGLNFVKSVDSDMFDVVLFDKLNYHQFQPLFYQVAASQIEPSSISFPFRYIFRNKKKVFIRKAKATRIDVAVKKLHTSIGTFDYDYLILAMGCTNNFFGNSHLAQHALTLKSTYEAIQVRNHILEQFEDMINSNNLEDQTLLTLVIVGAGPTGVELAGAFAEIRSKVLPKDFHRIDIKKLRIILIEGSGNTLSAMGAKSQRDAKKYLEKLGVEVMLNTQVTNYDGQVLTTQDGTQIETKTVIWAAGVKANHIEGIEDSWCVRGRIKVDVYNESIHAPSLFVVGDMAYMSTDRYPNGHPQLANVAINQGKNLAKNLKRRELGKKQISYEYKDLGTMATIGKNKAVVDFPRIHLKGVFAWFIWMSLHLMLVLTVRNKLIIFINWIWVYFTRNTTLGIILKKEDQSA